MWVVCGGVLGEMAATSGALSVSICVCVSPLCVCVCAIFALSHITLDLAACLPVCLAATSIDL